MTDLYSLIADQWRPIAEADKDIAYIHDMAGLRIGGSHPIWVRDEDGRVYEALWSDAGRDALTATGGDHG